MVSGKMKNKLNVLYEDNHIIVVEKPINVLSQSDITNDYDLLSMVKDYIKVKYNKPGNVYIGLVHRLDRPVGGIMIFARTSKAAKRLNEEMNNNQFSKYYYAIVHGIPKKKEDTLVDNIVKLDNGNSVVRKDGKKSILQYKVVKENVEKCKTLLNIKLLTGRHHQIRVQLSSRGYPICGDQRYGVIDKTPLALFAYKLEFVHPVTKENMSFQIEFPHNGYWKDFIN